jgi:hypothetical protein
MSTLNTKAKDSELESTNWGDPTGKGIMAAMNEMFDDAPNKEKAKEVIQDIAPEPEKKVIEPEVVEPKVAEPKKAEVVEPIVEEDIIEEEFFTENTEEDTKKDEESKPFDEADFDKQTEESVVGMEAKAGDKFRELRAELKEAKKQVISPDITTKLQYLELKAQEAEGLRERLEEISSQSAKLKVEASDEYNNSIVKPAMEIFQKADQLAGLYDIDPSAFKDIIRERDRKVQNQMIAEHLSDLSDFDRSEAYRMVQDFSSLMNSREKMLSNADKEIERQQVQRIESDKAFLAEQKKAVQVIQKDIWEKYKDKIPGFLEDGKETSEYKKLMSKSLSIDFSQSKARDQAYASFAGVALPHAMKELHAMRKRLSVYESNDDKAVKSTPKPSSSVSATPNSEKAEGSFVDRFANIDFDS